MSPTTMQAIRFHDYGPPENLVLETVDRPEVAAGHVLVHIHAVGVHPWDWKVRKGLYKDVLPVTLPHIPGIDLAGVVEEVGPGVSTLEKGDAVYGRGGATYAEFASVPATSLARMPHRLSFDEAAAVPVGVATAWAAVCESANVEKGQRVFVQGAAGGVGMYAVQLAHWKGAEVIATTSTDNYVFVASLGADTVIDYTTTHFEDVVHDVDAVIDTVGGDILERSAHIIKPGGILVAVVGQAPPEVASSRGITITTVQGRPTTALMDQVTALIDEGTLRVAVGAIFPLAEAARAHAESEKGHGRGRIVLHITGEIRNHH